MKTPAMKLIFDYKVAKKIVGKSNWVSTNKLYENCHSERRPKELLFITLQAEIEVGNKSQIALNIDSSLALRMTN